MVRSSNQLAQAKSAVHHHSYFPAVQRSTIGTFVSVSGAHETKRLEHLSQSTHTHTVCSMELWSARQSPPTDIRPVKQNWELSLSSKLFSASIPPSHRYPVLRGVTHMKATMDTHTHTHTLTLNCIKRTIKDRPGCSQVHCLHALIQTSTPTLNY